MSEQAHTGQGVNWLVVLGAVAALWAVFAFATDGASWQVDTIGAGGIAALTAGLVLRASRRRHP